MEHCENCHAELADYGNQDSDQHSSKGSLMDIADAIQIVLELARENIISESDAELNEIEEYRDQAIEACDTLEDFTVNHLGGD